MIVKEFIDIKKNNLQTCLCMEDVRSFNVGISFKGHFLLGMPPINLMGILLVYLTPDNAHPVNASIKQSGWDREQQAKTGN